MKFESLISSFFLLIILNISSCTSDPDPIEEETIPPNVTITSPAEGEIFDLGEVLEISATAQDGSGVNFVRFYIDNTEVHYTETTPYIYSWNTQEASLGAHSIKVEASDNKNNMAAKTVGIILGEPTLSFSVNGKVSNRIMGTALSGMVVKLSSSSKVSGADGKFSFSEDLLAGNYLLEIDETEAYLSTIHGFDIDENMTADIEMFLYPKPATVNKKSDGFIKGVSMFDAGPWMGQDLYPDAFNDTFNKLKDMNANLVTVFDPVFVTVVGNDSVKMSTSANTSYPWDMLSEPQYNSLTSSADSRSLDFMYWFGVWPQDEYQLNGKSFNQTVFSGIVLSDAFWQDWFSEYTRHLVSYAQVAEANGVAYISIGHGLNYATSPAQFSSETLYHILWSDMIAEIRNVYSGDILYFGTSRSFDAPNYEGSMEIEYYESDAYTDTFISLFDAFGVIISNITTEVNPSVAQVKSSVSNILGKYQVFAKPIILWTWVPSVDGAANRYGHLEPVLDVNNIANSYQVDFYEQADIYEGLLEAVNETTVNVKGIISHGYMYYDAFGKYEPRDMATAFDKSASVRRKPAEKILEYWFSGY